MPNRAFNHGDPKTRWTWWLVIPAIVAALLGCSPGAGVDVGHVVIIHADALIEDAEAPGEACDIHPGEEMSDDGCCGCHPYSDPESCDASCTPVPEPCTELPAGVACEELPVFYDGQTYYRIGKGTEPKNDEYVYEMGQSGENGKIRRNGGDSNAGVSFWSTKEAAIAARTRIGSTAKIHKVTGYPDKELIFVAHPPANHYHLVPNKAGMTLADYKASLKKVKLIKDDP